MTRQFTSLTTIGTEPVRYSDRARWMHNNGFRSLWLANGRRHAAAINAARRNDAEAVKSHASTLGGCRQPVTFTKSALAVARKIDADVPAYRIAGRTVLIPSLTWNYRGNRQVAVIEWLPMWGARS